MTVSTTKRVYILLAQHVSA